MFGFREKNGVYTVHPETPTKTSLTILTMICKKGYSFQL